MDLMKGCFSRSIIGFYIFVLVNFIKPIQIDKPSTRRYKTFVKSFKTFEIIPFYSKAITLRKDAKKSQIYLKELPKKYQKVYIPLNSHPDLLKF